MRRLFLFLLLALPAFVSAENSFTRHPQLDAYLDKGDYFEFARAYRQQIHSSDAITTSELYYAAYYESLFGNAETSNSCIDKVVAGNVSDSIAAKLLQLKLQNCFRIFQYAKADSVCTQLTFRYASVISASDMADIKNTGDLTKALRDVPPQTMERNGDLELHFKRDIANLLRVPVSVNGKEGKFIVDTGANLSTISESGAKRMGVQPIDATFGVVSSSKSSVDAKLGLAKEIRLGNVTFHNVIFIVLPDASLRFAGGLYKIKGIIGLPVIAQLGEIQVNAKGTIRSPVQQSDYSGERNLGMMGNTPIAEVEFYGQPHTYIFDTGAGTSVFSKNFQAQYNDSLQNIVEKSSRVGGAGGVQEIRVIRIKNLHYKFGGQSGLLKSGMIQLNGSSEAINAYYGIVGEDIFRQWDTMTINFAKGFVTFK